VPAGAQPLHLSELHAAAASRVQGQAQDGEHARHGGVAREGHLVDAAEQLARHLHQRGGLLEVHPTAVQAELTKLVLLVFVVDAAGDRLGVTLEAPFEADAQTLGEGHTADAPRPLAVEKIVRTASGTHHR
jgi:hypothetical protein